MADQLFNGRRIRLLTPVDNHRRESLAIDVGTRFQGDNAVRTLGPVTAARGKPRSIRVDNGPELIAKSLHCWPYFNDVRLDFSRPGKPTDNAYIESFNGRLRQEYLNANWFMDLEDAQAKLDQCRDDYHHRRPHGALAQATPDRLA